MKTRLATLALSFLALAGCAENNASVAITTICATPDDPLQCAFSATCDAQPLGPNVLDTSFSPNQLWLFVQVDNQLADNASLDDYRTNTNTAYVQEFEVEYEGATLPVAAGSILGAATVPAGGSAVISVVPIPAAITAMLAGLVPVGGSMEIAAKLKITGVYGDTTKFESGFYRIPVQVCDGCITLPVCAAGEIRAACPSATQRPATVLCVTP